MAKKNKTFDIEKALFPEKDKLVKDEESGTYEAQIIDGELDPLDCSFMNDNCVDINTEGLSYIILTRENLNTMLRLIDEAEVEYEKEYLEDDE
jgi:hypothetical protein